MTNSRTIHVSLDHLAAEVAAFPFVSRQSLQAATSSLCLNMTGATGKLWRRGERFFTKRFPNLSIDELIALRNEIWFDPQSNYDATGKHDPRPVIRLDQLLRSTANRCLAVRGATAEPELGFETGITGASGPASRRAFRWLMFAMPSDLLLAGLARGGSGPARVNMISPSVDAVLRSKGYAETHLHLGAGFDFSTAWAAATNVAARTEGRYAMSYDAFQSPGADHFEGTVLAQWHVRSCLVRYVLASFLKKRQPDQTLREYCDAIANHHHWTGFLQQHESTLRKAISDLQAGRLFAQGNNGTRKSQRRAFSRFQVAYASLTGASNDRPPNRLDEVQRLDPISRFSRIYPHAGPSVQLQFLWSGMDYLNDHQHDRDFACLFWQVERVRGRVYRHCIQRPMTPGLTNFIRFYDRKSAVVRLLENVELESCAKLGGAGQGLKSLEVRTSPYGDRDRQLSWLNELQSHAMKICEDSVSLPKIAGIRWDAGPDRQDVDGRYGRYDHKAWNKLECGLVLHFLKFRGSNTDQGKPRAFDFGEHADPSDTVRGNRDATNNGFRWRQFIRMNEINAKAVADAIAVSPKLLRFLRGIDVCRDEHGVPCWVIAPLFHQLRNRIHEIAASFRHQTGIELPLLRTTAHVGEDFVHLATGLRYMDEAVEHLPLRNGDRVGHGLALGIPAREWATETNRMPMPLEDRWMDLIWERRWHSRQGFPVEVSRRAFVDAEIVRLSGEIFRDDRTRRSFSWTADKATLLVDWLHDRTKLREIGFDAGQIVHLPAKSLLRQLQRYMTEPAVYRRCRQVQWINVADDGESVFELQRAVRKRYADLGITIEVNPISNLLVGNITDLQGHPLWRIAPGLGNDQESTLRICVGSDDPFPFSTTLTEEYQFLFDSLVLAGRSQAEAREWLHLIVQMGFESRFTIDGWHRGDSRVTNR